MNNLFSTKYRILTTDNHPIIQHGLGLIIRKLLNKAVITCANSVSATLDSLSAEKVDLLIIGIDIPGGNNFQMIERIKEIHPRIKILVFSAYEAETYALRYLKIGVNGYLEKDASVDEIEKAIKNILLRGKYLSARVQDLILDAYYPGQYVETASLRLTNRELEIARLMVKGEGTNSIGLKLDLKVSTISTHKKNIFHKLKISNVQELVTELRLNQEI